MNFSYEEKVTFSSMLLTYNCEGLHKLGIKEMEVKNTKRKQIRFTHYKDEVKRLFDTYPYPLRQLWKDLCADYSKQFIKALQDFERKIRPFEFTPEINQKILFWRSNGIKFSDIAKALNCSSARIINDQYKALTAKKRNKFPPASNQESNDYLLQNAPITPLESPQDTVQLESNNDFDLTFYEQTMNDGFDHGILFDL